MKNKMFFMLLKNRLKSNRNKNITLIIPISIVCLCVFSSNLLYYSLKDYINSYKNSIELRTISVNYSDEDNFENLKQQLEQNENIEMIVNEYERAPHAVCFCLQLANKYKDGIVFLKPINLKTCPNVIDGRKIIDNDKNVIILPNKIYADSKVKNIINQEEYIDCTDLINKEIDIKFETDNNTFVKKFKVIGIYDSEIYKETEILYVPVEIIKELNEEINYVPESFRLNLIVDKIENLESVNNYIYDNNITERSIIAEEYNKTFENISFIERNVISESDISLDTLLLIKNIAYFLLIISIVLLFIMLIATDIDKIYFSSMDIGLMRIQGYKESQIQLLTILENIIVSIISFFISLFVLMIIEKIAVVFINNFISKDYIGITYNEIKNQLFYIKSVPLKFNLLNITKTFIIMLFFQLSNTFIINKYAFSKTISKNLKRK